MITKCRFYLLIAALSIVFATSGFAASLPKAPGMTYLETSKILQTSQLQRGMKGYGLTVFQGTKIEKFEVEILGVLRQANSGKDYILARFAGGPLSKRGLGVAHGMSGSPVYIGGKLVGAVSAALSYSKEPIGMITPIADMVEALDENLPKRATGYSAIELAAPSVVEGRTYNKVVIDGPNQSSEPAPGELHVRSLAMPVTAVGLSSGGIKHLQEILKPFNVSVTNGISGIGKDVKANAPLVPGAAVGVSLASGDIDLSATGTVTYRKGNKLVAFGHPFLTVGAIDAPMTTAYIVDVLAGYDSSTKLGFAMKTVGRVFQDRPWSVAGAVGEMPNMVPVTVTVNDHSQKRNKVFHVKVINHPQLAAQLVALVVGEAITQMHSTPGDATANVSYEMNVDRLGAIKQSNVYFDPAAINKTATKDIITMLQVVSTNAFSPLDIKSVNVNVNITGKRETAVVDRIFVKKSEYAPGETVDVGVVLRPYKKDRITKTFSIKIPATAQDGKVLLQVKGGGTQATMMDMLLSQVSGGDSAGTSDPTANADNVKQLVDKVLERERNDQIVVQILMPTTAVNVGGETLSGLPSSIADIMKSSKNSGLRMEREEAKQVFDSSMIVSGTAKLTISVKQKSSEEAKSSSDKAQSASASVDVDEYASNSGVDTEYVSQEDNLFMAVENMATEPSVTVTEEPVEEPAAKPAKAESKVAPKNAPKADAKQPAAPTPKNDVKTVVRQPQVWSQRTRAEFAKGTFSGVAASTENKLELTPTLKKLAETPEQFVWAVAPTRDGVFAGTGNSGKIFHIINTGDAKVFFETNELEVHSLARDSKGNLYAGTSPNGRIFKITPDGKGKEIYKTAERYVVALTVDSKDNIYAGVGDGGKVYRITPDGKADVFVETNEQQILSLGWANDGSLLVGTGIEGVVYKVSPNGTPHPIFDAAESAIASVVGDSEGNIYAGTAPKGVIYKIAPDGSAKPVFTAAAKVLSMAVDQANNVYAISDGTLVRIAPDETALQLDSAKDKVQYLTLAYSAGTLYAGTGNIGSVYVGKRGDTDGTFESPVHDAKLVSKWGRIKWTADVPEAASVELQTRSGNVETPDSTWSVWSKGYTSSGEQIATPDARYVQYRVTLKSVKAGVTPRVSSVTLSYMTPNQAPTVKLNEPAAGAILSGSKGIKWSGSDPDKDTLTYDLFYSKDNKQWTALMGGQVTGASEKKLTTAEIAGKVKSELDNSSDVPDDMKKVITDGQDEAVASAAADTKAAGQSSTSTSYNWDTSKVEDGTYYVKVVASDKSSNATGALIDSAVSEPITICNTPPQVSLISKKNIEVTGSGLATVNGSASSKLIDIAGVQFRIDGGDWMAAAADDGVFDSSVETFTVTSSTLTPGSHKLEIQAVDAAGNASSETVDVKVK